MWFFRGSLLALQGPKELTVSPAMGAAKRSLRNRHPLLGGTASQRPILQLHLTPSIQRPGLHLCVPPAFLVLNLLQLCLRPVHR